MYWAPTVYGMPNRGSLVPGKNLFALKICDYQPCYKKERLRLKEGTWLAQGHTAAWACSRQSPTLNSSAPLSKANGAELLHFEWMGNLVYIRNLEFKGFFTLIWIASGTSSTYNHTCSSFMAWWQMGEIRVESYQWVLSSVTCPATWEKALSGYWQRQCFWLLPSALVRAAICRQLQEALFRGSHFQLHNNPVGHHWHPQYYIFWNWDSFRDVK